MQEAKWCSPQPKQSWLTEGYKCCPIRLPIFQVSCQHWWLWVSRWQLHTHAMSASILYIRWSGAIPTRRVCSLLAAFKNSEKRKRNANELLRYFIKSGLPFICYEKSLANEKVLMFVRRVVYLWKTLLIHGGRRANILWYQSWQSAIEINFYAFSRRASLTVGFIKLHSDGNFVCRVSRFCRCLLICVVRQLRGAMRHMWYAAV